MSKGFFGLFNNTLYELQDNQEIYHVARDVGTSISSNKQNDIFTATITLSNVQDDSYTNREKCLQTIDFIDKKGIRSISSLVPMYRMHVDYSLFDLVTNDQIDTAILTKQVDAVNVALFLGLDVGTNELVYRVAKEVRHQVELIYKTEVPYGIMERRMSGIILKINRIVLEQMQEDVCHDHDHKEHHHSPPPKPDHICLYGYHNPPQPELDLRRKPSPHQKYVFSEHYVTLFDTEREGIVLNSIEILGRPRKIIMDISMLLNNYFFVSDRKVIIEEVYKNYREFVHESRPHYHHPLPPIGVEVPPPHCHHKPHPPKEKPGANEVFEVTNFSGPEGTEAIE